MVDIFDELSGTSQTSGDIFDQLAKQKPSRARSIASAAPKGAIKGLHDISALLSLNPESREGGKFYKRDRELIEEFLPTQDKGIENFLERAGSLAPTIAAGPGGLGVKALQIAAGAAGGELAKGIGFGGTGQAVGELAGLSGPGLLKAAGRKISGIKNAPIEKLPSGLTKPRAVEAKRPRLGTITKEQQTNAIDKLNKETSQLAKTAIEKHVPISQKIQQGFDFDTHFKNAYGPLKDAAFRANPQIDITPISDLLSKQRKAFAGIRNPHPDAMKIIKDVKRFSNNPTTGMRDLYKIRLSNNAKKKHIYETGLVSGKQREYIKYLDDFNRAIDESFKNTLPANSPWIKEFSSLNKEYGSYQKGLKVLDSLKEVIGDVPNLKSLGKLLSNPKSQQKLAINMGQTGADEIIQIAKDAKLATQSIRNIPKKEWGKWDAAFPLGYFVPVAGSLLGTGATVVKGIQGARATYGRFLTTPARRKATASALKAITKNDLDAYKRATTRLLTAIDEEED